MGTYYTLENYDWLCVVQPELDPAQVDFKHIFNAAMRSRIEQVCRRAGPEPPVIRTPNEIMESDHADGHDLTRSSPKSVRFGTNIRPASATTWEGYSGTSGTGKMLPAASMFAVPPAVRHSA